MCVVEAGPDGTGRNTERCCDLGRVLTDEVQENQDGSLVGGQAAEGPLERIAIDEREDVIPGLRPIGGEHADGACEACPPSGLVVALIHEDPRGPGMEQLRIAQGRQLLPDRDQALLGGVLGKARVTEDPARDRVETIEVGPGQDGKRLPVSVLRLNDEITVHLRSAL